MSEFKASNLKNNAIWEERIETTQRAIDKIYLSLTDDEKQIEDEVKRLNEKHNDWVKKNESRYIKSNQPKTREKQTERFNNEIASRSDKLQEKITNLHENLTEIVEKKQKKIKKLESDIEKYKNHMFYETGGVKCECCDFTYYNDLQKKKHEEGLVHKLNAGIIPPIQNGLTCLCGKQFTQYHGIKEKNEDYYECFINCCSKNTTLPNSKAHKLNDELDDKINPIEITIQNRRQIFHYLGILNERNTLKQMINRLQEAWEYSFGEHLKHVPMEDTRRMFLLNEERNNIYSIEEDGSPVDLCTIEEVTDKDEIACFGRGLQLNFCYRRVPYDLRDRNPTIKMDKEGVYQFFDFPDGGLNYNKMLENETPEQRQKLSEILENIRNPEKKTTKTTTTIKT